MLNRKSTSNNEKHQTVSNNVLVYDLPEAARILRLHPETVRKYCREGRIQSVNISKSTKKPLYRITPDAILQFLKGNNNG